MEEPISIHQYDEQQQQQQIESQSVGLPWKMLGLFLMVLMLVLVIINNTTRKTMYALLRAMGVGVKRIPKVIKELKRKGFHFSGLIIPIIYLLGLNYTTFITRQFAYTLMGIITILFFIWECLRLYIPAVKKFYVDRFSGIMREKERDSFNGVLFYLMGTTISIYYFSPIIAIASTLFLILGDFTAALVGISYGRTKIFGKKSLEGTLAMFGVCLLISLALFWRSNLGEQLAFWGALSATLVELLNPSFIDDNLTIPCLSGLAIHLISIRLGAIIPDHSLY
ncbi:hypothetical protein DFA_00929 [Cavenderia fasciculata]|uniref:Phosphatidate cytidylyltransferase n=1 Tax=Cavenderia fasciculata TaxID=261658 RepID=F4PUN7_CACFS|nr:uncharacterized protein DFA_00929 [Cavenderia fasciculata]EGG21056.1 hypothetical protein DFA_00929 [Cavenderia fasciculata]|eukprot:XP_004358906.1 hypothetical protein DFA_00929 [Cavenderia fasciculata]